MSNLLIYQSSAGSGKTYKLAKEYLKLAFKYPGAFKSILAITFTNKATGEMKSRVLKFLIDLSGDKNEILKKQLIEEGVEGEISSLAKSTLNAILHNYSDFSISTIDSFFNRVLRSFSKELKLQIGYDIELDSKKVMNEITDMMLKGLKYDEDLKKYLTEFIFMKINEDKGWDVEKDIKKLGGEIFKERYWEKKFQAAESGNSTEISDSRKKIKVLLSDINKIIREFENNLSDIGDEAERVMKSYELEAGDFAYGENGVMGFLLNKIRYAKEFDLEKSKRAAGVYESNQGWFSKTSGKKELIQKAADGGLYSLLQKAVEYINSESSEYNTATELKNTIYILGIFEDLNSRLNDYRKENGKILQSDVNSILQGIISEDNSPFIYEKIGSNFRNILVDEFQDTSSFQWKNLLPLIINVLSEKNTALIVGDVKQSIYRWRSGNMKLLLSQIYEDLDNFREMVKTEYLKTNRRSRKEIVEFNNLFFQKAVDKIIDGIDDEEYISLIKKAYNTENVVQEYEKQGGYININFFNTDDNSENTSKEKADEKVITIIADVLHDGYDLSDILILVRTNEEAKRISGILADAGYRIISTESLMVNNSPKVRLIVDLVKYITDNKDELAKTDALYNYIAHIQNNNPDFGNFFGNINKIFIEKMPGEFFKSNEIPKINPRLYDAGIYEVCENLIKIFKFDSIADPYLIKLQDLILEYSKESNPDLKSFLDWWEENKNDFTIDSPADTNAVRIMTIHKAKGLQGKIVIVPYVNWKINIDGTKDLIWVSSEQNPFNKSSAFAVKAKLSLRKTFFKKDFNYEFAQTRLDNMNLLYVTFTRAEDRLYVIVPGKRQNDNIGRLIRDVMNENHEIINDTFESGAKTKNTKSPGESKAKSEILRHYISNDWYKKTIIKPKHKQLIEFTDSGFAYKVNDGVIFHEVLSRLTTFNDIKEVIKKVITEGIISEKDAEKFTRGINKLKDNPLVRGWFNEEWEVKSESDILLNDGSVIRPDRVLIKGKEAVVIDYKTGKEKDEHKKQISKYAEALSGMGFSKVDKFLLYIDDEADKDVRIVEVKG